MGPFQRILRNLGALFTGRLISVLQQYIIPAVFAHRYGIAGFGEWGALSSAVAALSMLNFGVQTYMNQDLALRFQRGETESYHVRQSTALRLMLAVIAIAAVLCLSFFAIPFDTLLRLDISRSAAQWTLYLLALQVIFTILLGYLGGIFMVCALAHRGSQWNNIQAFTSSAGLFLGVLLHAPFPVLAAAQLGGVVVCILGVLIDLRITAPDIFPSLRFWDGSSVKGILTGSGYFGLIAMSSFLTYQAPVLLMQRIVGPVAVAGFILMRTLFSTARQLLSMFTQSMGPEITNLFGRRDWPALSRLYNYSERLIFFLISLANLGLLMLSPVLITLWMYKKSAAGAPHHNVSDLFSIYPYVLSAALSIAISLKEHKFIFQFSTNTHEELARVMTWSYTAMFFISIGTIYYAGVTGFLWTWLATEVLQTVRLIRLNEKLFAHVEQIDTIFITRLAGICGAGILIAFAALWRTAALPLLTQTLIAVAYGLVIAAVSWRLFGVREVYANMMGRVSKRFA